jgi:hypothetical protein
MTPKAPTADVGPLQTDVVNTEGFYDPESSYRKCRALTDYRQTDVVNTEGFYHPESSYS